MTIIIKLNIGEPWPPPQGFAWAGETPKLEFCNDCRRYRDAGYIDRSPVGDWAVFQCNCMEKDKYVAIRRLP